MKISIKNRFNNVDILSGGFESIKVAVKFAVENKINLRSADLRGASLQQSKGVKFSSCCWSGHGECGRQLLYVKLKGELWFFCGCFSGSEGDLRAYIKDGDDKRNPSRTKALEFLISCMQD